MTSNSTPGCRLSELSAVSLRGLRKHLNLIFPLYPVTHSSVRSQPPLADQRNRLRMTLWPTFASSHCSGTCSWCMPRVTITRSRLQQFPVFRKITVPQHRTLKWGLYYLTAAHLHSVWLLLEWGTSKQIPCHQARTASTASLAARWFISAASSCGRVLHSLAGLTPQCLRATIWIRRLHWNTGTGLPGVWSGTSCV